MTTSSETSSASPDRPAKPLSPRGVAVAALIGTSIEFYDFFVYTFSVTLVISPIFFPAGDGLTSALVAFSTIGVGFFARPIGGLVFAHFGDKVGRKNTLVVSLVMMSLATVLVGCLPTYSQVGMLAPVLLVGLRVVQGFAVGGEWGGAVLLATEKAPLGKRAFYGSFPMYGSFFGGIGSAGVLALVQLMPRDAMLSWGWRIPFLLSIVLLAVGLVVRLRIDESTAFLEAKEQQKIVKLPIATVLRRYWKTVFVATAATFIVHTQSICTTFLSSYSVASFNVPTESALYATVTASAVAVVGLAIVSRFIDGRDRRIFAFLGALLLVLWVWPAFLLAQHYGSAGLIIATCVTYVGLVLHQVVISSLLADLFPAEIRFTGMTLSYQTSAVVGGGMLPILVPYLVAEAGGSYAPAVIIMVLTCFVTMTGLLLIKRSTATTSSHSPSVTAQREDIGEFAPSVPHHTPEVRYYNITRDDA